MYTRANKCQQQNVPILTVTYVQKVRLRAISVIEVTRNLNKLSFLRKQIVRAAAAIMLSLEKFGNRV